MKKWQNSIMPQSERNVSWIELFYDLIFVAAAHQLTLMLVGAGSFFDSMTSLLLFIPLIWCWMSHTLFTNFFSDRSWFYHFMTFLTILGTVTLVILMPTALTTHSTWFAYAYVFIKVILVIQYIIWSFLQIHRLLDMLPIIIGNIGSGLLWGLSILSPVPQVWWVIAMLIDVLTPAFTKTKNVAQNMNPHHLPERMGLLTVIVLGEMIISLVISAFALPLTKEVILVLAAGIAITFLIFWTYFRFIDQAIIGYDKSTSRIYFYSHLPMVLGLICVAAGYQGILGGKNVSFLLIFGFTLFTLSQRMMRYVQDQRFLKRQLVLVALLLPILTWYYFFAAGALINLAVLTASFAVYLIVAEFILGWENYSAGNAPNNRVRWGNDK